MLVQLHSRTGERRIPTSEVPDFLELTLEADQRVVSIEWKDDPARYYSYRGRLRKTATWTWTVWIESRF